jgi:hypothetical protein
VILLQLLEWFEWFEETNGYAPTRIGIDDGVFRQLCDEFCFSEFDREVFRKFVVEGNANKGGQ